MSSELEGVGAGDNDLRKKNTPPNCLRISMYWYAHAHTNKCNKSGFGSFKIKSWSVELAQWVKFFLPSLSRSIQRPMWWRRELTQESCPLTLHTHAHPCTSTHVPAYVSNTCNFFFIAKSHKQ